MNGDNKDEAHRPRPLSAGIWTLFSWLRRSERSSSSESLSSVGSARTAASFDFLAPGNCNITNTPIVLTTPLNPPSETYKRRLQDRNLRRTRDRDLTLHRKYGLYREQVNGYDGFSLPPARWTAGITVDRPDRERRATSECLQRRAAYVPGKRRAPLPPAIATCVSLPRTYKRKRPAPKPPVKNTFKDNNNIVPLINDPVRMNSNSKSEVKLVQNNELLSSSKTERCDKKVTNSKDTKSRTDKNFLKHIFENRKRNSVTETASVRLLPSISELDKQAAEIIENNKRQSRNNFTFDNLNNLQDTTALYEGNSWFCTSCLRKYNSSVNSCNYCAPDKRSYFKKDDSKLFSPRSSIYTQTNSNGESATSSQSSMNERKMLKEILKEMKDSLPKNNKTHKVSDVIAELPTLRIGSTVQETYKNLPSQPSSSREKNHNNSKIISISSQLSETQSNFNRKNAPNYITDKRLLSGTKTTDPLRNNIIQHEVTLEPENNSSYTNNQHIQKIKKANHIPILLSDKSKSEYSQKLHITKVREDDTEKYRIKDPDNIQNTSNVQNQSSSLSIKTNDSKEINKNKSLVHETVTNILDQRQHFPKEHIQLDTTSTDQNKALSTTNKAVESERSTQRPFELHFLNSANSVVVNRVTVVTSHLNNKSSETSKENSVKNVQNSCAQTCSPKENETRIIDSLPIDSKACPDYNVKRDNNETYLQTEANSMKTSVDVKPQFNLHTPLKISSLLNPLYSPDTTTIKENKSSGPDACKQLQKELHSNFNAIDIDKASTREDKKALGKVTPPVTTTPELKTTDQCNDIKQPMQTKEALNVECFVERRKETLKDVSYEQKALPSTSGCSSSEIRNSNNNLDKLDQYDRRRFFINQLEQSIAKGDEVAAAEAAVKLAKLRLSCSVLSFSSQIVGESSKDEKPVLGSGTSSPTDTSLEKSLIPHALSTVTLDHVGITTQIPKIGTVDKLLENKNNVTKLADSNNIKQPFYTCEPSSSSPPVVTDDTVPINVWIEDKQAARGPIRLRISRRATMADIKRQAELSLGLATQLQRWIVGRTLSTDDAATVISLAGPDFRAPFYLCIVQPDKNEKPIHLNNEAISSVKDTKDDISAANKNGDFYAELMKLEKQSLVPNIDPFECGVCMEECAVGAGVVLRECIHTFCRECLSDVVQHCQEPAVACPAVGCTGFLQEREIRTIVSSEEYERWLARGLATAECGTRNAFHCRTKDCSGWAFCDPGVRRFPCPVCKNTNCVQCQAIHEGETCDQYQTKLREAVTAAETNKDDEGTQALLNSLISRGEALECPECRAIITKKWGCDWVKCSACKTEICWVTKGKRWGPGGRGDTSGGCRCGVDGQRCHPSCGYCH